MIIRRCLLVLILISGPARATEKLALLDISGTRDADWEAQDERLLEKLRAGIAGATGCQMADTAGLFAEPADANWGPLAGQAQEHLQQGEKFYWGLKPDRAISELREALRILRAVFPGLSDLSLLVQTHLLLGATYQSLGQGAQAEEAYHQVLMLEPQYRLDETRFNPLVIESFEKVRGSLLAETRGSISFISQPQGASVKLDGRAAGITPVTVPAVLPGGHYVSLSRDGYRTWFGVIELQPGGNLRQEIFLQEGSSIARLRHRHRIERAGTAGARAEDIRPLLEAGDAHWLVLVAIHHLGGQTTLDLAIAEAPGGEASALGIFADTDAEIESASRQVAGWLRGERTFVVRRTGLGGTTGGGPPPPPPGPAWYGSWWFWTIVGVVAAGAAGTTAGLLLSRESGYRVEVIR